MKDPTTLTFGPMTPGDAEQIVDWRYPDEYAMYNVSAEDREESVRSMIDPANGFCAVRDGAELMGFCSIGPDGRVPGWTYDDSAVDVGAGMRPDLTGEGNGTAFLGQVVWFAQAEVGDRPLRATIASWNTRALTAAKHVGFRPVGSFERADGVEFTVLVRENAR